MGTTANTIYFILAALAWVAVIAYAVHNWKTRKSNREWFDILFQGLTLGAGSSFIIFLMFVCVLAPR